MLGYHTAGDGAGGLFRWDASAWNTAEIIAGRTTPDDGGTRIVPTGQTSSPGLWRRVAAAKERLNVRCFGARGDSTTDDSDAFEAACFYGPVYVPQGTYKITRVIKLYGRTSIDGAHKTTSIISATVDGYVFHSEGGQGGFIRNLHFQNCTSLGCIALTRASGAPIWAGANVWNLGPLWFTGCAGPHLLIENSFDMSIQDIDILSPSLHPDATAPTPATDAIIIARGEVNNTNFDGLRIEFPPYCGVYVGPDAEISTQEGKIDCGFQSAGSPAEGGFHVDGGLLSLANFLLTGFRTPKLVIKGTGRVIGDALSTLGGGGGAPHVVVNGTYAQVGVTQTGSRPSAPSFVWHGHVGHSHIQVDTVTPAIVDATTTSPVRARVTIAGKTDNSLSFYSGVVGDAGPYYKNHLAAISSGNANRAKINSYSNFGANLFTINEAAQFAVNQRVFVEWAPHHGLDMRLDPTRMEGNAPLFATLLATTVSSSSYDSNTGYTTITLGTSFDEDAYTGRWIYTAAGRWHKIITSNGTDITVPYDVTAEFPASSAVTIRTGAMVNASIAGDRVVWGRDDMLVSASLETLRTRGRGPNEVYPLADGA